MKQVPLGNSGLMVSELCLGSMTWGTQNTEAEGHAQLDRAIDRGVTFIDTAEVYPTNPATAETAGRTEEIIGSWLAARGGRERLVLATKIAGIGQKAVRNGTPITGPEVVAAVEGSLRRLGTDVIDLYQLHWPNRGSYHFRRNWAYDPSGQDRAETLAHMQEVLGVLADLVAAGKIRAFGLSNETVWGTMQWLRQAELGAGPPVVSIQNEYSLLCRLFDTDGAEMAVNENIPLLAYTPLAAGLLTGKYAGDVTPERTRRAATPDLGGRTTPRVWEAVSAYLGIARDAGLDPATMAIAWIRTRPFPVIPIVGATSVEQLDLSLDAADTVLPPEVMAAIATAAKAHPMPF